MRYRFIGLFPWASNLTTDDNYWRSLDLGLDDAVRWYWRVMQWSFSVNIAGSAIIVDSGTFVSNIQNSTAATLGLPGFPLNEQYLPVGWGINTAGSGPIEFHLFDPITNIGIPDIPSGINYGAPSGDFQPTIQVTDGGTLKVSRNNPDAAVWKASAVVCTWDGKTLNMWEKLAVTYTGTITITADGYWPCLKSDSTAPVWDAATGTQLLDPHQLDQLP